MSLEYYILSSAKKLQTEAQRVEIYDWPENLEEFNLKHCLWIFWEKSQAPEMLHKKGPIKGGKGEI